MAENRRAQEIDFSDDDLVCVPKAQLFAIAFGENTFHGHSVRQKSWKRSRALFDDVDAGGVAEPDGAIVAEGGSGNDRDIGFAQQAIGEILRGQSELADVHQHVKCALRFHCGDVGDL